MNKTSLFVTALLLLALTACGGGGGGGGNGGDPPAGNPPPPPPPPPPAEEPPTACMPEADAVFPAFVYYVPDSGTASVDFRVASSDGCRTEFIIREGWGAQNPSGVFANGQGFIAWTRTSDLAQVQLLRFTVSGSPGAEILEIGEVETVLTSHTHIFPYVDAWRNEHEELLVVSLAFTTPEDQDHRLTLVDVATGDLTELWSMTMWDQFDCLRAAEDAGENPYLADACIMGVFARPSWSADGRQIYFNHGMDHRLPGFDEHEGQARLERRDEIDGCRGSLPDLGNGWCGPEIVHTNPAGASRSPHIGRPRPAGIDDAPVLLASTFMYWDQLSDLADFRIVVLDANACVELFDDRARVEPLLAAGDAWRSCLYEGIALQEFGPGGSPDWTLDWRRLYYHHRLYEESIVDAIRVFNPTGIPTDGDREVIEDGILGRTLR